MRILYSFLLSLTIASNAIAANITQVTFASSTPTVTNIQIANLNSVRGIYSAGAYAWAYEDNTNVAFYNGKQWGPGVTLPGVTGIDGIYPAYPVTGKTGAAWAQVETSKGLGISYFDDTTGTWSQPELFGEILGLKDQPDPSTVSVATSGGAIAVLGEEINGNTTYYSSKASANSQWIRDSAHGSHFLNWLDVFDDQQPVLSFITYDMNQGSSLFYRLPLTGKNAGIALPDARAFPPLSRLMDLNIINADGPLVYVVYTKDHTPHAQEMFAIRDFSKQSNWKQIVRTTPPGAILNYLGTPDNANKGLICDPAYKGKFKYIIISCIDITQPKPKWQIIPLVINNSGGMWEELTRADGAWISTSQDGRNKTGGIYSYDQKTKSLTDTHRPLNQAFRQITQVGATGLLLCYETAPIQLYYYDSKNNLGWKKLDVGNTALTSCNFSTAGTSNRILHRTSSGNTVWLFESIGDR